MALKGSPRSTNLLAAGDKSTAEYMGRLAGMIEPIQTIDGGWIFPGRPEDTFATREVAEEWARDFAELKAKQPPLDGLNFTELCARFIEEEGNGSPCVNPAGCPSPEECDWCGDLHFEVQKSTEEALRRTPIADVMDAIAAVAFLLDPNMRDTGLADDILLALDAWLVSGLPPRLRTQALADCEAAERAARP